MKSLDLIKKFLRLFGILEFFSLILDIATKFAVIVSNTIYFIITFWFFVFKAQTVSKTIYQNTNEKIEVFIIKGHLIMMEIQVPFYAISSILLSMYRYRVSDYSTDAFQASGRLIGIIMIEYVEYILFKKVRVFLNFVHLNDSIVLILSTGGLSIVVQNIL